MFLKLISIISVLFSTSVFAETPEWINTITVSGDMRLRYDFLKKESPANTPDRHRNQIRARLLTEAKPIEDVTVGIRIATGDSSNVITSNNTTMDNAGADKALWLDLGYIAWQPNEKAKFIGGKMETPFYTVAKSQLIFDSDLTPEGAAGSYALPANLFFNWGAFWIEERSSGSDNGPSDTGLFAAQFGWSGEIGATKLTIGASEYYYGGIKGKPVINPSGSGVTQYSGRGNSTDNTGTVALYEKSFAIANLFFDASLGQISLFADVAQNTEARSQNFAFLTGLRYGKIKEKRDWSITYSYRKTEKDAVVAGLKDSDFADGFNDSRGHTLAVRYAIAPKSYFEIYGSMADVEISTTAKATERYMADVSIAF